MFTAVINEHKNTTKDTRSALESKRNVASKSIKKALTTSISSVSGSVDLICRNQEEIEKQVKLLHTQSEEFAKESAKWNSVYKKLNEGILELGHVDNWVKIIDKDLNFVAEVMDNVATKNKASEKKIR